MENSFNMGNEIMDTLREDDCVEIATGRKTNRSDASARSSKSHNLSLNSYRLNDCLLKREDMDPSSYRYYSPMVTRDNITQETKNTFLDSKTSLNNTHRTMKLSKRTEKSEISDS